MKRSMISTVAAILASSFVFAQGPDNIRMLVGTYTEGSLSKGVYLYSFNQKDASAVRLDTAAAGNPSFIVPSKNWTRAYAVNEYNDGRQGVTAFTMTSRSIGVLNNVPINGADPCNLLILDGCLMTADYGGGSCSVLPLEEDGSVGELIREFSFGATKSLSWYGVKLAEDKQVKSHIHCAVESPDGKYVFITDLGTNFIHRVTIDGRSWGRDCISVWRSAKNIGPRHLVFSADGRFAYLIGELGDQLSVFSYNDGQLNEIQSLKAYSGKGRGSADIHLSPDGKFLYTSHRLAGDGIAIFRVDPETGMVSKAGFQPTGKHPRNFAITPNGCFLLCACRDSDAIEIYSRNPETGALQDTGRRIGIPKPVCIQFEK